MSATGQLLLTPEQRWTLPPTPELYRYLFGWVWAPGPIVVYCGLNPSTMTALKTDRK